MLATDTLDVEGPGFRLWSLIGVILGVAAVLGAGVPDPLAACVPEARRQPA